MGTADKRRRRGVQQTGVLAGHKKSGRKYLTQLQATGVMREADWARDDVPDFIWPIVVLQALGGSKYLDFAKWQTRCVDDLSKLDGFETKGRLDGRLTSLAALGDEDERARLIIVDTALELGLLDPNISEVLSLYTGRPAPWFVFEPETDPPNESRAFKGLALAIYSVLRDRHKEALIKVLPVWARVADQTLRTDGITIDLLKDYPGNSSKRDKAESVIRAMFGASHGAAEEREPDVWEASRTWAKSFWNLNGQVTECMPEELAELETLPAEPDDDLVAKNLTVESDQLALDDPLDERQDAVALVNSVGEMLARYVAALQTVVPLDLFEPTKNEVHAGLITRAARWVVAGLRSPHTWNGEQGAEVTRILAEAEIYLAWLAANPDGYRTFQEYGRGRAKLAGLHAAELLSKLEDVPDEWRQAQKKFVNIGGGDQVLDLTNVSVESTFSGKSVREMASSSDLAELYKNVYQMSSGILHGEWWAVTEYSMQRCMNPLHRFHLIPTLDGFSTGDKRLAEYWIHVLGKLMLASLREQGVDAPVHEVADFLGIPDLQSDESGESDVAEGPSATD